MSNKARDWARSVHLANPSEALILRELAEFHHAEKDTAWPSISALHESCNGVSERTIRRGLKSLTNQGIIVRIQRGTKNQSSVYQMNFNWPPVVVPDESQPATQGSSTGHPGIVNRPPRVVQPATQGIHIRNEPLRTIIEPVEPVELEPEIQPDIGIAEDDEFVTRTIAAYESNIGTIVPFVAEQIKAIGEFDRPPPDWGEIAVGQAAVANKRSWGYVRSILNRFISQGNTEDMRKGARRNGIPGDRGHTEAERDLEGLRAVSNTGP